MKKEVLSYQQKQEPYKSYKYGNTTLGEAGCGVFAIINAVFSLTGNMIDYKELANWAGKEQYVSNVGSKHTITKQAANVFGNQYFFYCTECLVFAKIGNVTNFGYLQDEKSYNYIWKKLIDNLQNEQVAVALVQGHFIAIVKYDETVDKVLVLDSAADISRQTTIYGDWKSKEELDYNSKQGVTKLKLRSCLTFLKKR